MNKTRETFITSAASLYNSLEQFRGQLSSIAAMAAEAGVDKDRMQLLGRLAAIDEALSLAHQVMGSTCIPILAKLGEEGGK